MTRSRRSIFLIGLRGSGKTTVARILAGQRRAAVVDLDHELVDKTGMSIADMFARYGQAYFRRVESDVLRSTLETARSKSLIVSTGGGVVVRQVNRERLRRSNAMRVYLRCDAEELDRRVRQDAHTAASRPALTELSGVAEIAKLLEIREPWYRQVATHTIDVTRLSPEQTAGMIAKLYLEAAGT